MNINMKIPVIVLLLFIIIQSTSGLQLNASDSQETVKLVKSWEFITPGNARLVKWSPDGSKLAVSVWWDKTIGSDVKEYGKVVVYEVNGESNIQSDLIIFRLWILVDR